MIAAHRLVAIAYPHQRRLVVPIGEEQVERNGVVSRLKIVSVPVTKCPIRKLSSRACWLCPCSALKTSRSTASSRSLAVKRGGDLGYRDAGCHYDARSPCDVAYGAPAGFIQIEFREQCGIEVDRSDRGNRVSGFDLGQRFPRPAFPLPVDQAPPRISCAVSNPRTRSRVAPR